MNRPCAEPGCPNIGNWNRGRCPTHQRAKDQARGTTTQRGYGSTHQQLRAALQRKMNQGHTYQCWRCGNDIDPEHWQLGHDDINRDVYRGPECVPCNTATSTR